MITNGKSDPGPEAPFERAIGMARPPVGTMPAVPVPAGLGNIVGFNGPINALPGVMQPQPGMTVTTPRVPGVASTERTGGTAAAGGDLRVRLRALPGRETQVYGPKSGAKADIDQGDAAFTETATQNKRYGFGNVSGKGGNILAILHDTNGLMFPYTPTVAVSQSVEYTGIHATHSLLDLRAYVRTPAPTFQVSGKFSVQNQREGEYALACIHFLRTVAKMYFGESDLANGTAGLPPPVLMFQGYGNALFGANEGGVKVVVEGFNFTFDDQVDMVTVRAGAGAVRLPTVFTLSVNLVGQQTPRALRRDFSLDQFRTGKLLEGKGGWF